MIRVHKIAHATYETPDLAQQAEYYTDIIGLTLIAKETDARQQAALRGAGVSDSAGRGPGRVREASRRASDQDRAQEGSRAVDFRYGQLRRSEGHHHAGVQAWRIRASEVHPEGHRAVQARPRRFSRHRRETRHQVLLRRARL